MFRCVCTHTQNPSQSLLKAKKLTNKANPIRVRKVCVFLFIKTSGMSIRAFLYSRRAEKASAQTQRPSAIPLDDNDPDKATLPINQTSNKTNHSLSSANNLHVAERVTNRPASSECEDRNKALGRQEVVESILFIDLGLCTAWWHMVVNTFFLFIPQTQRQRLLQQSKKKNHTQCKTFHFIC